MLRILCDLRFLATIGSSFLSDGLQKIIILRMSFSRYGTNDCDISAMPITITKRIESSKKKNKSKFYIKIEEGMK